jgi:hypothetical protein
MLGVDDADQMVGGWIYFPEAGSKKSYYLDLQIDTFSQFNIVLSSTRPACRLRLSLVSCPIGLYPAISAAERISFRQVNRDTGHRLRQQLVDSVTGQVVERHRAGRGYEVGEKQFPMVQEEDLEAAQQKARERPFSAPPARPTSTPVSVETPAAKQRGSTSPLRLVGGSPRAEPLPEPAPLPPPRPIVENTRTIELDRFIPRDQMDDRYFNAPYYIVPRDQRDRDAAGAPCSATRPSMAGARTSPRRTSFPAPTPRCSKPSTATAARGSRRSRSNTSTSMRAGKRWSAWSPRRPVNGGWGRQQN